jgi:hypothetical protein
MPTRFAATAGLPPWGTGSAGPDRKWAESNRALSAWIAGKRPRLAEAVSVARSIRRHMESIFPLMSDIGAGTCPWCPEPCCIVTRVWFDFRDMLFFHLTETPLPPGPLHGKRQAVCRYLTGRGCMLPRVQRPWGCTQYLCLTQRRYLVKGNGRKRLADLEEAIRTIVALRMMMEESVTEIARA